MLLPPFSYLLCRLDTKFTVIFNDHDYCQDKGQHVRRREGVEHAVQSEKARKQDRQEDAEDDLPYGRIPKQP